MIEYKNIIFLDIDGVLNSQLFYEKKFSLGKKVRKNVSDLNYYKSQMCKEKIQWLNQLCKETNTAIVISSTWRKGREVKDLKSIFDHCGATFEIIDKTPYTGYERGTEISKWLKDNVEKYFNIPYYDFYRYAIIDDDSDMLLTQSNHFFKVDGYCGLTPNTIYKIRRFFTHETF